MPKGVLGGISPRLRHLESAFRVVDAAETNDASRPRQRLQRPARHPPARRQARLASNVSSGEITQQQSDTIMSRLASGIDSVLNRRMRGATTAAGGARGRDRDNHGDAR